MPKCVKVVVERYTREPWQVCQTVGLVITGRKSAGRQRGGYAVCVRAEVHKVLTSNCPTHPLPNTPQHSCQSVQVANSSFVSHPGADGSFTRYESQIDARIELYKNIFLRPVVYYIALGEFTLLVGCQKLLIHRYIRDSRYITPRSSIPTNIIPSRTCCLCK